MNVRKSSSVQVSRTKWSVSAIELSKIVAKTGRQLTPEIMDYLQEVVANEQSRLDKSRSSR